MPAKSKLIGLTGPSAFSQDCMNVVEEFYEANFVLLYQGRDANVSYWLDQVDGVILAGGIDIHPSVYSESVWSNHNLSKFDIRRDCREFQIIDHCRQKGKPMLGICRGHQLLGLSHGLGFVMDISGSAICHQPRGQNIQYDPKEPMHSVRVANPDILYGEEWRMPTDAEERKVVRNVLGHKDNNKLWVNSFHHQAVAYNPKRDYKNDDGINILGIGRVDMQCCKEIIELMEGPNWIGVQWHPEYDWKENTASRVVLDRFKRMVEAQ